MKASGPESRRAAAREQLPIAVQVKCLESELGGWEQSTNLLNVSPFGAALRIAHPTERGRLLHFALPMPRRLRSYDHDLDLYQVWSVVRHVKTLPAEPEHLPHFEIGVAFVGKNLPAGSFFDPAQRYDVGTPTVSTDLWALLERPATEESRAGSLERRREARHSVTDDVVIEIYDATGRVYAREATKTENISRHGMAAITSLNIVRGRYVRVRSARYEIAIIAAVRRLGQVGNGRKRLHLEFVDQQWPPL